MGCMHDKFVRITITANKLYKLILKKGGGCNALNKNSRL